MTFASGLLAVARRLLRKYGQNVTFGRVAEGTFVPTTGAVGAGTTSSYTAYCAPLSSQGTVNLTSGKKEVDKDTLLQSDFQMLVEVNDSSTIPLVGDTCTLFSKVYRLIAVTNYVAQGSILVYKVQVRI